MHEGERVVSPELAARLVASQFPEWAGLGLQPLAVAGSDNVMIRLGEDLVLRFPRIASAAGSLEAEARWLDWVAKDTSLAVPEVVALGRPGQGYSWPWAVLRWIAGRDAREAPVEDLSAAEALAGFVLTLSGRAVPVGLPVKPGDLRSRDQFLRQMVGKITDEADVGDVTQAWEAALALPDWNGQPVVVHADLHPLNLISRNGALAAVIDWGGVGAGDPALDLICGWTVLEAPGRAAFRRRLAVDDATWARGWAYAFSKAAMALPYYRDTNPALRAVMLRTLRRCLAERPDCMGPVRWI
ncbi:MAG: aminoglycoside phosphotransferase family protein [Tabrizicola sp.]